jgi:CubicO group peptidase (beta-lactamase class C family)
MGALILVAQGKLALEEDVNLRLLPWRVPASPLTREHKVTLRRLASHSAGLTARSGSHFAPGERAPTLLQVLDGKPPARFGPVRVERVPGTTDQPPRCRR